MNNVQTANTIKDLCRARNITINTLLTDCNIRKGLIYDMEKRDKTPSPEILERIADRLNCSVDYLLGRDEQQKKPAPEDGDGLSEKQRMVYERLVKLTPKNLEIAIGQLDVLLALQEKRDKN